MRLESAVYSSREGLDAHGKAISVIGDNIANTNTVAFRGSRVEFADLLPNGGECRDVAGIPSTGSGVSIQEIRELQEAGAIEFTGRPLDIAIDGNGYLLLGDASAPYLSKAGNLQIDREGYLVNSSGYRVLGRTGAAGDGLENGEEGDAEAGIALSEINMLDFGTVGRATTSAVLNGNLDSSAAISTPPANPNNFSDLGSAASYISNVDVFDSLGTRQSVSLYFFKTQANTWTVQGYVDGAAVGKESGIPEKIGEGEIQFTETGELPEGNQTLNLQTNYAGAAGSNVVVDLSQIKQQATSFNVGIVSQDGEAAGMVEGYEISKSGEVYALLDSGNRSLIATLQLGMVQNVDGLNRIGKNLYIATDVSGELNIGSPDTGGLGAISNSSLERSSVDISTEFVNLTLLQRGYQANSQVLSATMQMLRDAIAMLR